MNCSIRGCESPNKNQTVNLNSIIMVMRHRLQRQAEPFLFATQVSCEEREQLLQWHRESSGSSSMINRRLDPVTGTALNTNDKVSV